MEVEVENRAVIPLRREIEKIPVTLIKHRLEKTRHFATNDEFSQYKYFIDGKIAEVM
jgi:hypothetical protein